MYVYCTCTSQLFCPFLPLRSLSLDILSSLTCTCIFVSLFAFSFFLPFLLSAPCPRQCLSVPVFFPLFSYLPLCGSTCTICYSSFNQYCSNSLTNLSSLSSLSTRFCISSYLALSSLPSLTFPRSLYLPPVLACLTAFLSSLVFSVCDSTCTMPFLSLSKLLRCSD